MLRNVRAHPRTLVAPLAAALLLLGACGVNVGTRSDDGSEAKPSAPTVTVTRTAAPAPSPTGESPGAADEGSGLDEGAHTATPTPEVPSPPRSFRPTYDLSRQDLPGFVTPSGNIGCLFDHYDGPHVRCDRREFDHPPVDKPADCDFDWGHAVELARGRRGSLACVGDTVLGLPGQTDGSRVLQYGETARYRGILCTSRETGLTCRALGHGFIVSRASIRVF